MTRDELIEEAARIIHADCARGLAVYPMHTARKIADLFYGALNAPSEAMMKAATINTKDPVGLFAISAWQAMLTASPLAPEGDGT